MTLRYQTISRAAETGFSTIDHARDWQTTQEAALKRPKPGNPEAIRQLETEAKVLGLLQHDHIVKLLGSGTDEQGPYLALEWIEGPSLNNVVDQHPLSDGRLADVLRPLLQSLAAVHRAGFCHADLSASNILLRAADGGPVLIDFGNAGYLDDDQPRSLAHPNIGSIHHMAPELFEGFAPGVRSDLYALGVLSFQALTDHYPFEGDSRAQVITAHLRQPPPALPHSILGAWIHRLLSRNAADRPASAEEALLALPVDSCRPTGDQ